VRRRVGGKGGGENFVFRQLREGGKTKKKVHCAKKGVKKRRCRVSGGASSEGFPGGGEMLAKRRVGAHREGDQKTSTSRTEC